MSSSIYIAYLYAITLPSRYFVIFLIFRLSNRILILTLYITLQQKYCTLISIAYCYAITLSPFRPHISEVELIQKQFLTVGLFHKMQLS